MKYLSVKDVAGLWGINERRVRVLCDDGRVDGAMKVGKSWLIPSDASKPNDARIASKKGEPSDVRTHYDVDFKTYEKTYPDANGFFGKYGGSYVSPELQKAFQEVYD